MKKAYQVKLVWCDIWHWNTVLGFVYSEARCAMDGAWNALNCSSTQIVTPVFWWRPHKFLSGWLNESLVNPWRCQAAFNSKSSAVATRGLLIKSYYTTTVCAATAWNVYFQPSWYWSSLKAQVLGTWNDSTREEIPKATMYLQSNVTTQQGTFFFNTFYCTVWFV